MKKTYKQGRTVSGMILSLYCIIALLVVMISSERIQYGKEETIHLNYVAVIAAIVIFITLFSLRTKLILNFKEGTFRNVQSILGISIGSTHSLKSYQAMVLRLDVQQYQNDGTLRMFLFVPSVKIKKSAFVVELYDSNNDVSHAVFYGKRNEATSIAIDIARYFPSIKAYKDRIKPGNEFDFAKLKRK